MIRYICRIKIKIKNTVRIPRLCLGTKYTLGIITTLVNGKVYLQNRNNNTKCCLYPSALSWVLTY